MPQRQNVEAMCTLGKKQELGCVQACVQTSGMLQPSAEEKVPGQSCPQHSLSMEDLLQQEEHEARGRCHKCVSDRKLFAAAKRTLTSRPLCGGY